MGGPGRRGKAKGCYLTLLAFSPYTETLAVSTQATDMSEAAEMGDRQVHPPQDPILCLPLLRIHNDQSANMFPNAQVRVLSS